MFKLSQGKSGKFHFTLHAKNQQVVPGRPAAQLARHPCDRQERKSVANSTTTVRAARSGIPGHAQAQSVRFAVLIGQPSRGRERPSTLHS